MSEVRKFKVYPGSNKGLYFSVYIFRTKDQMYDHFKQSNVDTEWKQPGQDECDFTAITQSWMRYDITPDSEILKPDMGRILFYSGGFDAGIVSHEMTHATLYWAIRKRIKAASLYNDKNAEEKFCWAQGYLVNQFWTKFYSLQKKTSWLN